MAGIEKLKGKLALYLSTLSDSAQQLLLRSLERGQEDGTNDAASELILSALREVLREKQPHVPLRGYVKQQYFQFADGFMSKVDFVHKVEACVSPSSISAIWNWIERDILTEEQSNRLDESCGELSEKEQKAKAQSFVDELRDPITKYVQKIQKEMGGDQKFSNHLGGEIVYRDLLDILVSKERLMPLQPILSRIPGKISSWSSPEGQETYSMVNKYIQQMPLKASWLFSALTQYLSSPKLKVQLAVKLAGSDDAFQVAATVYAPGIHQVIALMEGHLAKFEKDLHRHDSLSNAISSLSVWRSLERSMDAELEISVKSDWGKQIAAMKTRLSELLKNEIEAAPGLLRKALRAPKADSREIADENMLKDASKAVELFHHAERMKDSLALNGPITQVRKELDQSFEMLSTSLIERSRQAVGQDAKTCRTLADAAAMFAKHLFDENYAAALRRQLKAAGAAQEALVAEA